MATIQQFQAVIFDMDGLLLDSERIALAAFDATCDHFGLGNEADLFRQCVGTNQALGDSILEKGLRGKVDSIEFGSRWDSEYTARLANAPVPLKEGAGELLDLLIDLGIPRAVATSTTTQRASQKLASAGLLDRFDALVGGDRVERSKPHPDIYVRAALAVGASPRACLALEDSENGVRSAMAAGMTVVQIPDLIEPTPDLVALGHIVLRSLNDVRTYEFRELST